MRPSLQPDRHRPVIASQYLSPGPCPAATHRLCARSCAYSVETLLLLRDRNCQSCFPGTAPADDPLRRVPRPLSANPPDTAARTPQCSPDRSAPAPSRTPPAPMAKSRWESSRSSAAAKALPESSASFFRFHCLVPRRAPATVGARRSPVHTSPAGVRLRASAHIPAGRKSPRTALSQPRHTNILKAVLSVRFSSSLRAHLPRIRTHVSTEGFALACRLPNKGLLLLVLYSPEFFVDVRIMRLKPVPEGSPQHARSRSRRPALHHVVLPIEEIRGIAGIKGHRRESRKWRERRSGPFPAVAYQVANPEGARSFRICSRRYRIPLMKIKIAVPRAGGFFSPWIAPFAPALARSISGSMKLRFARQRSPQPLGVGRCLRVAHIDGPLQRQANFAKHRAVEPQISLAPPKCRMLHAFLFLPRPRLVTPQRAVFIPFRLNKAQIILVRYIAAIDRKSRNFDRMCFQFVVPAEFITRLQG